MQQEKFKYVHACKHRSQNLACTDCSSALEQATYKFYTILEPGQIGDEEARIKIQICACMQAHKPKPSVHGL